MKAPEERNINRVIGIFCSKAPEERNINRTIPSGNTIINLGIMRVNDCNGNPFWAFLPKKIVMESVAQRETPK